MEGLLSAEFGIPDNDLVPSSAGRRLAGAAVTLGLPPPALCRSLGLSVAAACAVLTEPRLWLDAERG